MDVVWRRLFPDRLLIRTKSTRRERTKCHSTDHVRPRQLHKDGLGSGQGSVGGNVHCGTKATVQRATQLAADSAGASLPAASCASKADRPAFDSLQHDPAFQLPAGGGTLSRKLIDLYFTLFKMILDGKIGTAASVSASASWPCRICGSTGCGAMLLALVVGRGKQGGCSVCARFHCKLVAGGRCRRRVGGTTNGWQGVGGFDWLSVHSWPWPCEN